MFVTEKMPEDAKVNLPFDVVVEADGSKPTLWRWAVDKERDAYIILAGTAGGAYEGTDKTEYYILNWQGHLISISADPLGRTYGESGTSMHWRINEIFTPETLKANKEDVMFLVKDAFRAIGEFFDGGKFVAVNIEFKKPLNIVAGGSRIELGSE
ncbi:hypothetical protein [Methylophilus sp. 5]|uniref:hypothetical protein n=1 Tax=Methylophilus sp. 5 TaxID=1112274 RepID=UPI00048CD90F|nr:hypothetical protein [Methylophilus sp. 5]